jgi:branched-chain amino acid transport system substrate-binding protein
VIFQSVELVSYSKEKSMKKGRVSTRFSFLAVLAMVSMTLLAACGDNTATAPAPTTSLLATTAASTTSAAGATTAAGGTTAAASTLTGQIKIGAIATLTGKNSPFGIAIKNGFDLAVEEMNNNKFLGGATIQLVTLDDKGDKQEGISVMTKLLDQEKVVAVLGPTLSSTALAADPIAQQKGVPVLGTSNTANGITEMGNFVFRDSLPEASVIPGAVSGVSVKLKPKKAAMMYESTNEFTKSADDVFKTELQKNGITLTGNEAYSKGDTDFRTQLNKLKATNPDLLIVSGLIGEAVPIVQQAREVGITQPILGGNGFNTPAIYQQGKDAAEGVIVGSAWFLGSTNPKSQAFVAAYKKKFNTDPDQFAAQAYTGAYLMATAIKNANSTDPKAIRDALAQIKNYDSVLGSYSFDANRNPVHNPVVVVVKGGKFELYQ